MNKYKNKLMSKNGKVVIQLAREMLTYHKGDKIKTVSEYVELFTTARGTVQSAIKFLQEVNALELLSRGQLGTFIVKIDYKKLWELSDYSVIMGVMPLPYSKRYEGLATGLYHSFNESAIPFSLAFMRGSTKRIEALSLGKYNFAVISKLAARLEMRKSSNIEIIHEFGEGSYVGNHIVIFRDKNDKMIKDGMRIALDTTSIDQVILTTNECLDKNVEYVETPYNQIIQKIQNNEVDAAIWNIDEIQEKNIEYHTYPLSSDKTRELAREDTIAVVVVTKENKDFGTILNHFIDFDEIKKIQKKVFNNEMIPIY